MFGSAASTITDSGDHLCQPIHHQARQLCSYSHCAILGPNFPDGVSLGPLRVQVAWCPHALVTTSYSSWLLTLTSGGQGDSKFD